MRSEVAVLPVVVEIERGGRVESRHRGSAIAINRQGRRLLELGDCAAKVFPRSAIKPIQSLPLIETGAADAFSLNSEHLALACASHSGEIQHTERVRKWLSHIGLGVDDLRCGPQSPGHQGTKTDMIRQNRKPDRAHNNSTGKHTGMLSVVTHMGESLADYLNPDHPLQLRTKKTLETLCGETLNLPPGIDGCGAPNWPISLNGLAAGASRLAACDGMNTDQSTALRRMTDAMQAHPNLVAGTDRCCTAIMRASKHIIAKTGAEGVYLVGHRPSGTGIALKIEDGASRAAETLAIGILHHLDLIDDDELANLTGVFEPVLKNFAGDQVGRVALAKDWRDT